MVRVGPRLPPPILVKYYAYEATTTFGFFAPVFTLFLLWRDLSYTQVGFLGSVSAGIVVLGEIPTGYLGDRIGRRNSLLVGSVLLAASLFGFVVATSFVAIAGLYVLWALGLAFQSGSGDAWLYDVLQERLDERGFTRVRGRGGSVDRWASAGMMLTAGFLYDADPRLPFVAGGLLLCGSVVVLLAMPTTRTRDADESLTVADAVPVLRRQLTTPPLRSTVVYLALFFGITATANTYVQPISTRAVGLPETSLGPLYAGFTVVAAMASYVAGDVEAVLSTRWAIVFVPAVVAVFFAVPLVAPVAAVPVFFLVRSARATVTPIASGYINDRTGSVGRATVLSAASMAYASVRLPLKPLSGVVADLTSPLVTLAGLGACFLVVGLGVVVWGSPGGQSAA